jgi:hypothetical protein
LFGTLPESTTSSRLRHPDLFGILPESATSSRLRHPDLFGILPESTTSSRLRHPDLFGILPESATSRRLRLVRDPSFRVAAPRKDAGQAGMTVKVLPQESPSQRHGRMPDKPA